jgi:hypothetical protein
MFGKLKDKYDVRLLAPCKRLDVPVCAHADMLVGSLDGRVIVTRSYYEENKDLFSGVDPILTDEEHGREYPHDILLNFIDAKTAVVGLEKHVSKYAKTKKIINVKQGYTRCSTLVGQNFAVSADAGILSALSTLGYDTLKISEGDVMLKGYGHGFIGGASFAFGDDVYFFGSLSYHKDKDKIKGFLRRNGAKIHELDDTPLTDLGGAVIFDN